ncbi:MAG TPA: pyridoxamine 5'-phosphate oxidase family protein [Amphiplicatus sp.]|nr:pyridoxamine 5'-phosphate oxidase family protein [Amphiplicatus sp.]
MSISMDAKARKKFLAILDDALDLTIATNRADGYPQATVVSFVHDGDKIYLGCSPASQKAQNMLRDDRVSVALTAPYKSWDEIRGASIGGRARRVTETEELQRVGALMLARFPQVAEFMKSGMMEETFVFRIDPEVISILDYSLGFGHTELHDGA